MEICKTPAINKELYAFLIILTISIAVPFTAHLFLKDKPDTPQVTQQSSQTKIVTNTVYITNVVYKLPPETNITWLSSPVTQKWDWDEKRGVWIPDPNLKESYRYTPHIQLGLKEDGNVIWRRK